MRKKLLWSGVGAVGVVLVALAATMLFAEKVGVAEIVVQEGAVVDQATLQQALANSPDCDGLHVTEVTSIGKGKLLARIAGMHGEHALNPARTALQRVAGVERVEIELQRN